MINLNISFSELELVDKLVFKTTGLVLSDLETEAESQEYFAHYFQLSGRTVKFRKAKITPTKTGQFVTIWKRNDNGITEPFDISDNFDFYIIATRKDSNFGIFIFPKAVLHENSILSDKIRDGKRGIRVYPPWDLASNKQAQKTQLWQVKYFLDLSGEAMIDWARVKELFHLDSGLHQAG